MKRYLDQRLRLQSLRVLDALDTHGSLLKASAALGVSQPALTKTVKDLEEIVGAQLFDRHARGLRPTPAGTLMIASGRRVLAELKRTDEDLDHLTNPYGGVAAIGALPVVAAGLLPMLLLRLRRDNPDIRVRLEEGRTEEMLPLLASGQIDLIVGRFYELGVLDPFERDELWQDPFALVVRAGHPLLTADPLSADSLRGYEFVLPSTPQRVASEIDNIAALLGLSEVPTIRSTSYGFIREILLSTDAVTIMPAMLMLGDLNRGHLAARSLPIDTPTRPAGIITMPGRQLNGATKAFIDCLHDHIQEIVDLGLASVARSGARKTGSRGNRRNSV